MKLVIAGLLGGACILMAQQLFAGGRGPSPSEQLVEMPTKPRSIPFVLQDNLVRIEISIKGRRQSAVLDSGSGPVVLHRSLTHSLRLSEGVKGMDAGGAGKETQQLRPVVLDDLRIGPLRFRKLEAYSGDLSHLSSSAGFPIHLLVGGPAFAWGSVTIDYPKRRVTFGRTKSAAKCLAPIPVEFVEGTPVVQVDLRPAQGSPPVRLRLMVDLGTRHTAAMIGGAFLRTDAGQRLERANAERQVGTGIGGKVQGKIAHVADISIGGSRFGGADVSLTRDIAAIEMGTIDGTLGVPFWQNGSITFDYPARTICIDSLNRQI